MDPSKRVIICDAPSALCLFRQMGVSVDWLGLHGTACRCVIVCGWDELLRGISYMCLYLYRDYLVRWRAKVPWPIRC